MPKQKLNAAFCLRASCPVGKRKITYWDDVIPNFILECQASGTKTFALRYTDDDGRQRQYKIGRYGDITVARARTAAKVLRSKADLGGNPAEEKAQRKAALRYAELAAQHLASAQATLRRPDNTESNLRVHIVPRWGRYRLTDIRPQDVARWLAEKRAEGLQPATVDKIRMVFSRSFELARMWGISGAETNPVRNAPRVRFNNARNRYVTPAEAQRLLDVAGRSRNPRLREIIELLLLTGARKSELLNARWEHINLDRKEWLIPMSKTGKARHVPLSQAAAQVLEALPRFEGCPFVLPNPRTRRPFTCIKHPWDTAKSLAGITDLRIHDLRHSAASFMINSGVDLYTVGRVLGHADHQSTMRYSHLANETLLAAVEAGAAKLTSGRTEVGGEDRGV